MDNVGIHKTPHVTRSRVLPSGLQDSRSLAWTINTIHCVNPITISKVKLVRQVLDNQLTNLAPCFLVHLYQ
jgi:hypothetical protein